MGLRLPKTICPDLDSEEKNVVDSKGRLNQRTSNEENRTYFRDGFDRRINVHFHEKRTGLVRRSSHANQRRTGMHDGLLFDHCHIGCWSYRILHTRQR